ncbi:putative nepenthesin [Helianthus debilis subsp. tardiflorus]
MHSQQIGYLPIMSRFVYAPSPFPASVSATSGAVIVWIIVLFSCNTLSFASASASVVEPTTVTLLPPHASGNFGAIFVPLYPYLPNSSGDGASRRHRRTFDVPYANARMDLYDDLLITGYYSTRLWIGTPPQKFALIVDTGSSVTYVPCSTCVHCGKHQNPKFDPDSSSTYQPVKCTIDCTCDSSMTQCTYAREYAEMSSSSGVLGEDIISFGDQSDISPQRATFGCENSESGELYTQRADGILGLGRGDLSLVDQLFHRAMIHDSFSLCYGGMDVGGGAMVLGGLIAPSGTVYAYSNPGRRYFRGGNSPYYNVDLKEVLVAGKRLPLDPSVFDGKHGTVLDSGTTYAYIPEAAFLAFKDAIMKELHSLKQIRGPDPNYKDICFSGAGSDVSKLPENFPSVEMVFGKGHKLLLSPENYLFRHSRVRGAYCLGIFQNPKEPTTILGGIIVRNIFVMYERENHRIGFWKTNCSELWARLIASATPDKLHLSPDISPPAPLAPPFHISPGSKVASIIFYMSLDIKYPMLESHIAELTQLIATELHVNSSQVYLSDLTYEGNGSLTIWSITPLKPAEYMSKATASDIIARIAEDEIHLPKSFGKHRISNWYIEAVPNRTWWENYRNVIIILMVFIIGFLVLTTAWLWRYRQRTNIPYRPVGSAMSQLELQTVLS